VGSPVKPQCGNDKRDISEWVIFETLIENDSVATQKTIMKSKTITAQRFSRRPVQMST
jgi:diaminopimelate epimerase